MGEPCLHRVEKLHRLCDRFTSKTAFCPQDWIYSGSVADQFLLESTRGLQCLRKQQQASWGREQGCAHELAMRASRGWAFLHLSE